MTLAASDQASPQFARLAVRWSQGQVDRILGLLWEGYERVKNSNPVFEPASLERSITEKLELRVRDVMTGFEPFRVQHGPFEYETMLPPPAQPPQYDIAFILLADERIKWPAEAKVLETASRTADYVSDIRTEYETCRYGPFSASGAMLGYLLEGVPADVFENVQSQLGKPLNVVPSFEAKAHRASVHARTVPTGKDYPDTFLCHHLIFNFEGTQRTSSRARKPPKR